METFDEKYTLESFQALLAIDSTTGQFRAVQEWIERETRRLGYEPQTTHKGGVIVNLGGEGNPLVVTAHLGFVIQSYGRRRTRGAKEKKPPGRYNAAKKNGQTGRTKP